MIKAGFASDNANAISVYKLADNGTYAAGLVLAGYGTKPIPGAICDDAIQKAVDFTALQLQRSLTHLLDRRCEDFEYAKKLLTGKLDKLHETVLILQRSFGQGIYLAGVVCYIAGEHFICLPFGGAYAFLWDGGNAHSVTNDAVRDNGLPYIYDAIGGGTTFPATFAEGRLQDAMHLLCMTQMPPNDLLSPIVDALQQTDLKIAAYSIHKGLNSEVMPTAVLAFTQAGVPDISGGVPE